MIRPSSSSLRNSSQLAQSPTRLEFAISTRGAHSWVRITPTGLPDCTSSVSSSSRSRRLRQERVVRLPVAGGLAGAAVHHEVLGALGDLGVEVVHQHPQRGLGLPATSPTARCRAARGWGDGGCRRRVMRALRSLLRRRTGRRPRRPARRRSRSRARGSGRGRAHRPRARAAGVRRRRWPARASCRRWRRSSCAGSSAAGGGHQLDRDDPGQPVDRPAQLAGGGPAHRDVVLLHRARRDRVDAGRDGEPLELGDDRGLGVLRDHQAAVDAGVVGEERRQVVVARPVEEAVAAALGDRGHVGGDDRQEVEDVGDRRAVEVAVGLDPAGPSVGPSRPARPGCRRRCASSRPATVAACSTVSRAAPCTCGEQRSE